MSVNVNPDYKKTDIKPLTKEKADRFFDSLVPVHYLMDNCPCGKRHISLLPSPTAKMSRAANGYKSLSDAEGIRIIRKDDEFMRVSEQELIAVLWAKVGLLEERTETLLARIEALEAT
jgi:hypothetical protein